MSGRFNAARPKRTAESYATYHPDGSSSTSNTPHFDIRNPSALAPDAPEEDAVLEADVIGGGAGTKRNAVNIDGYDSDSENEGFDERARQRARGKKGKNEPNLAAQLDNYTKDGKTSAATAAPDDDDDEDMFGDLEEEVAADDDDDAPARKKGVRFMDASEIQGQVEDSKSGGHVSANFALDPKGKLSSHAMDDQESSDDEEDAALAAEEEGIDEEVGAGGLKRNAPKVDAFNMKAEQEEGRFDTEGNYVRKAGDRDAVHDSWLEGLSKKDMKKAAEAHSKREEERRQKLLEDDALVTSDILKSLILQLEKGESVLEALARLGKLQTKTKKIPRWKMTKKQKAEAEQHMDTEISPEEEKEQAKIKDAIASVTAAADQLMTRGQAEIYDAEREGLIRQYQRETGEEWKEPAKETILAEGERPVKMWEYRWVDGRDGADKQGPYDGATMTAWQDAGYFGEGVEFRREGEREWNRVAEFL